MPSESTRSINLGQYIYSCNAKKKRDEKIPRTRFAGTLLLVSDNSSKIQLVFYIKQENGGTDRLCLFLKKNYKYRMI